MHGTLLHSVSVSLVVSLAVAYRWAEGPVRWEDRQQARDLESQPHELT